MTWEQILSIVAIIVSALVGLATLFQNRKSNKLDERIVELEEKREDEKTLFENSASIHAEIDFEETAGHRFPRRVMIWNRGIKDAENLRVYIDNEPPSEVNYLLIDNKKDVLEILPSGDYYSYSFKTREENEPPIKVKVIFDDPQGSDQEYKRKLRV